MALFMPQSEMWDLPLPGKRGERHIPHWFGNLAFVFVGLICKICWRYKVEDRQNLRAFKDVSGVLLVSNHTSFLDVVFMYLACRPSQWVRLMGRETLFDNAGGFLGQLLSRVGAFPVKRDSADRIAVKRASRMLKNKELVGVLPEGTRRGRGTAEMKLHSGAAFIARMGKAPILPMTVRNAELVKQKGKGVRFPKISVQFGDPILVGDFDFLPKEDRLDACTWYAMRECFALSRRIPADQVDMKELFPTSPDFTEVFREHPVPRHSSQEVAAALDEGQQS